MKTAMAQTSTPRPTRVLYLFKGASRRELLKTVASGEATRSPLRGYDVLTEKEGLEVSFIDLNQEICLPKFIPAPARELALLPRLLHYDYVVTFDALPLCAVAAVVGRLFSRARVIYMAINAAVLIHRHEHNPLRTALLVQMWNSFYRVVCIAESQRKALISAGVREERTISIPFGIDVDFLAPVQYNPNGEYMVSIGRDLGRDYETLFAAVRGLPYRLVVATDYKNIPPSLQIPENVEIRYNASAREVRALYEGARLTCIILKGDETNEGSDCTGQTVMLEALSAGQPVIVTRRDWVGEYFQEGDDFVGAPVADRNAVKNSIVRLWEDESLRVRLSTNGRQTVRGRYSVEAMSRALYTLITNG